MFCLFQVICLLFLYPQYPVHYINNKVISLNIKNQMAKWFNNFIIADQIEL